MYSFQEATKKLSEPYSCFRLVTATKHITLNPKYIGKISAGIKEELNGQLKLYSERFNGVLVAFNNLKLLQSVGNIMDDMPCLHFDLQGEFVIFQPGIGSVLEGTVNKIGQDFVGCLVHDCFNASVPKPRHIDSENWIGSKLEMDEKFTFEVTKLFNQHGVASFQGRINSERRDSAANKRKRDSSATEGNDSFNPPAKRSRTISENTSTPMPGRNVKLFNPGVSFVQPAIANNGQAESVASDVTIDSGLGGGLSPVIDLAGAGPRDKVHKKKKKKHKDGEKSMDTSGDITGEDSSSKKHKKKLKKIKDEKSLDESVLENVSGSKKHKKHKKHKKEND